METFGLESKASRASRPYARGRRVQVVGCRVQGLGERDPPESPTPPHLQHTARVELPGKFGKNRPESLAHCRGGCFLCGNSREM